MGRLYTAVIDVGAGTAARDLFEITAATEKPIALHAFAITTDIETDTNEEQVSVQLSRFTGAFTSGSGGSTVTGYPLRYNDAADAATVETGNTTVITGGTEEILAQWWVNNRVGLEVIYAPEYRPTAAGTDALVLATLAASTASTAYDGYVIYEELV